MKIVALIEKGVKSKLIFLFLNSLHAGWFFMLLLSFDDFFQNDLFSKSSIRVSNSFDLDQAQQSVGPDLGPNWLQRLSADERVNRTICCEHSKKRVPLRHNIIILMFKKMQFSSFIILCFGFIGIVHVISKLCYKGTNLQRNYRKMTIKWSFSYNSFVKFHGATTWCCYIQICVIVRCVIKALHCNHILGT